MDQQIFVYVDLNGTSHLVGRLWLHNRKRVESATFRYDEEWLRNPARFPLEPALQMDAAPHHTAAGNLRKQRLAHIHAALRESESRKHRKNRHSFQIVDTLKTPQLLVDKWITRGLLQLNRTLVTSTPVSSAPSAIAPSNNSLASPSEAESYWRYTSARKSASSSIARPSFRVSHHLSRTSTAERVPSEMNSRRVRAAVTGERRSKAPSQSWSFKNAVSLRGNSLSTCSASDDGANDRADRVLRSRQGCRQVGSIRSRPSNVAIGRSENGKSSSQPPSSHQSCSRLNQRFAFHSATRV